MKKIIGMILAASMAISMTAAVNAENNPSVYIDGAKIDFEDQRLFPRAEYLKRWARTFNGTVKRDR